jgi:magnesium transporter
MKVCYEISAERLVASDSTRAQVIVFSCPDATEKEELAETYDLDAHTLESTLDIDEIPRLEFAPDRLFIIWKKPKSLTFTDELSFGMSSLGILLQPDKLIFITDQPYGLLEGKFFQRNASLSDLMLKVLLQTVHHYLGHLKGIKLLSGDIQKKINASMENRYLLQMFNLSETLIYYIDAIQGNGVVLARLRTAAGIKISLTPDEVEMLDDIIIDNQQCAKQAEIYSSVLSGLMDARGNIINNNMNVLLKNLTLINVVFLPLNLVASIGGMSEYSAITQHLDWRLSYFLFFLGMLVLGWITWVILQRRISALQGVDLKRKPRSTLH